MAISATMITHLAQAATYLCHLWRIEERPRECVVHWSATGMANVVARGGYLRKNGGTDGTDDASAISITGLTGSFYVKYRTRLDGTVYFGLAANNGTAAASSINFAIRVESNGTIKVYELGVLKATSTTTAKAGDFLRVQRDGTTLSYWHNRTKIYTSATASSATLYCDTSIVTTGATVNEAVFGYVPTVINVTDHSRSLSFQSETYTPLPMLPTQFSKSAGLKPGNAELTHILSSNGVTEADVIGGRWDYSRFDFIAVRYLTTTAALYSLSSTIDPTTDIAQWMKGQIGEIKLNNGRFTAELRSLSQPLSQEIGGIVGSLCVAPQLGDYLCGQPMDNYTHDTTVASASGLNVTVSLSPAKADAYFEYGLLRFRTGQNAFYEREIKNSVGNVLTLQRPFPFTPLAGDFVTVMAGCNRTRAKCKTFVNPANPSGTNIENMAGAFPDTPGTSKVYRFPS